MNYQSGFTAYETKSTRERCRVCASARLASKGRLPFSRPNSRVQYAPDCPLKLEHLALQVEIDPIGQRVQGTARLRLRVLQAGLKVVRLDARGLSVEKAWIGENEVKFTLGDRSISLVWPESLPTPAFDARIEARVQYRTENPARGLYFIAPDEAYPHKRHEVWSQGEDEDNQYWVPLLDYPHQKATWEVTATVPKNFTAISNGSLVSRREVGDQAIYHYSLASAHATYLLSLVVGQYVESSDQGPAGELVQYFVPKGREADGQRAFGGTPRMMEVYARRTGIPYPYEKYSQVAVQDFHIGGMENVTATTQTERTLHDERAHLDFSSDPLVSHELAHQWFGNLVTCRDWSHAWLNEGFATFLERVWVEENLAEYGTAEKAAEEAKYYSLLDLQAYLEEDGKEYRRPIVCKEYAEPMDLFDAHLYQKGGLVVVLLRATLGEAPFWQSIQHYLKKHRGGSVETIDLIRAIEETTGRNLREFFQQWVFSGGHPELEVAYSWDADAKRVEVAIEQKQTEGKSVLVRDGVETPVFALSMPVWMRFTDGSESRQTIEVRSLKERVFISAPSEPVLFRLDPGGATPKEMKFPRPKAMLFRQLAQDPDCLGRIEAAQELVSINGSDVSQALADQLVAETMWGVQVEIAEVLGKRRDAVAKAGLIRGLSVKNGKARKAVVHALGDFQSEDVTQALAEKLSGDVSLFVEAEATLAWVHSQRRPGVVSWDAAQVERVLKTVREKIATPSFSEVIAARAVKALGMVPGIERGEHPAVLALILECGTNGVAEEVRCEAIRVLGRILAFADRSVVPPIMAAMTGWIDGAPFRIQRVLIEALEISGRVEESLPLLTRIGAQAADPRPKRLAEIAIARLQAGSSGEGGAVLRGLRQSVETLEEKVRQLSAELEKLKPTTRA